jgi:hypothetical protein
MMHLLWDLQMAGGLDLRWKKFTRGIITGKGGLNMSLSASPPGEAGRRSGFAVFSRRTANPGLIMSDV